MNDLAMLSLFGVFMFGLILIVAFVLFLNRNEGAAEHPAPGE